MGAAASSGWGDPRASIEVENTFATLREAQVSTGGRLAPRCASGFSKTLPRRGQQAGWEPVCFPCRNALCSRKGTRDFPTVVCKSRGIFYSI